MHSHSEFERSNFLAAVLKSVAQDAEVLDAQVERVERGKGDVEVPVLQDDEAA